MRYLELFNKLPNFYKKAINRLEIRNTSMLLREIKNIENDYLH